MEANLRVPDALPPAGEAGEAILAQLRAIAALEKGEPAGGKGKGKGKATSAGDEIPSIDEPKACLAHHKGMTATVRLQKHLQQLAGLKYPNAQARREAFASAREDILKSVTLQEAKAERAKTPQTPRAGWRPLRKHRPAPRLVDAIAGNSGIVIGSMPGWDGELEFMKLQGLRKSKKDKGENGEQTQEEKIQDDKQAKAPERETDDMYGEGSGDEEEGTKKAESREAEVYKEPEPSKESGRSKQATVEDAAEEDEAAEGADTLEAEPAEQKAEGSGNGAGAKKPKKKPKKNKGKGRGTNW